LKFAERAKIHLLTQDKIKILVTRSGQANVHKVIEAPCAIASDVVLMAIRVSCSGP
jgi:hypothetical protein